MPATLAFGTLQYGQSKALQVTLSNTGTVSLTNIVLSFAKPLLNPYSQTNNCGTSLAAGRTCTITVTFAPTLVNINTSNTLSVVDGAGTQSVSLSGTGTAPSATLTPNSLAFGNVTRGTTSAIQVATLKNTGSGALTLGTVSFHFGFFNLQTTTQYKTVAAPNGQPAACGPTLAAGASCNYYVVFAPPATGTVVNSATMIVPDGVGLVGNTLTVTSTTR